MDVDLSRVSIPCQQKSQKDADSIRPARSCVSMAHNMTVLQKYAAAMMEVITEFVKRRHVGEGRGQADGRRGAAQK